MKVIITTAIFLCAFSVWAQRDSLAQRGSYASFRQVKLEDNSFLLEEAFNQEMGVIQHISTVTLDKVDFQTLQCSYTQEIPLTHRTHQLNISLNYMMMPDQRFSDRPTNGFGDFYVSYRPLLFDENDWLMLIPRFTLIIPTGDASRRLGYGAWGAQVNLAVTKRISDRTVAHVNAGLTQFFKFDHYEYIGDRSALTAERNVLFKNLGYSFVWHATNRVNFMFEHVVNMNADIDDNGFLFAQNTQVINPAIRYCIDRAHLQVVPGIGFPLTIARGEPIQRGIFFYLSFETSYR